MADKEKKDEKPKDRGMSMYTNARSKPKESGGGDGKVIDRVEKAAGEEKKPAEGEHKEPAKEMPHERRAKEREDMHKAHEMERRDQHGNMREEIRKMHSRHEAAHKAMAAKHMAEMADPGAGQGIGDQAGQQPSTAPVAGGASA